MNSTSQILIQAYAYTDLAGQPLTPEIAAIRYILISEDNRARFQDDSLFLHFIQFIMQNRYNASFPEQAYLYQQFISDCLDLKTVMHNKNLFNEDTWLSYTLNLLENLKTPYYQCYSTSLHHVVNTFSDEAMIRRVMASFYALMIKSSPEHLRLINTITSYAGKLSSACQISDSLLADILIENVGLLGQDKAYWLQSLAETMYEQLPQSGNWKLNLSWFIQSFMEKEILFTGTLHNQPGNIHEYIALRSQYMKDHMEIANDELFFAGARRNLSGQQGVDSTFLNTYAYNMNQKNYITDPAIGRDSEIDDLALILISPKKSPILLGEAGVGKTSVVEGLAYRLSQGNVPDLLKNKKIFKLTTTALLSGTKYVGEMEERMKQLTHELEDHPDVILFIDEVHTVVGAGSTESSNNDISNMLKPYIDRGDIKIIGATTKDEYDAFIAKDKALSRRFYPIYVEEPDEEITFAILKETIPSIEYTTRIKNGFTQEETDAILKELIVLCRPENQIAELTLFRPELPLTILEMAFSYAALNNRSCLAIDDLRNAFSRSSRLKKEIREHASTLWSKLN